MKTLTASERQPGARSSEARAGRPPSPLDQAIEQKGKAPWAGVVGAVLAHVLMIGGATVLARMPSDDGARAAVANTQMFEVELEPEPPPPPPPPVEEPEPEPEPTPRPRVEKPVEPPPEAAPAAAQAAQVLVKEPEPEEVVDFGDSFVQGNAANYAGGVTEASGTSSKAVRDTRAAAGGVPGGQGTDTSSVDRSRAPSLAGGVDWDCPFPEEADSDGVDQSAVTLHVKVSADGQVESVDVKDAPDRGFGREAKRCALRKRWQPGLDRAGKPVASATLIKVRFTR